MTGFYEDIHAAAEVVKNGGIILYPTDTVWGIGCSAINADAVNRIYALKEREDHKSMIILCTRQMLPQYTDAPVASLEMLAGFHKPVTVIYPAAKNLAANVVHANGSVAIRVPDDEFCTALLEACGVPLVSTSANFSNTAAPRIFEEVSEGIKKGVDYIPHHKRNDQTIAEPSAIIAFAANGSHTVIRP